MYVLYRPITWILPDEMDEVRIVMAKICMNYVDSGNRGNPPIWIVKPEAGCQGDGIFLVDGFQRLEDKMRTRLAKAGRKSPLATKNLLEDTGGLRRPPLLLRGGDAIHQ